MCASTASTAITAGKKEPRRRGEGSGAEGTPVLPDQSWGGTPRVSDSLPPFYNTPHIYQQELLEKIQRKLEPVRLPQEMHNAEQSNQCESFPPTS
eukprot:m.447871 g.447871  ORF g.447871 m.447871 type:complete len:95 (-) comp19572_c0_seq1:46-330(-)